MATVTKPIALDESLNTTELSSRNVADVLAQELSAVATAIGGIAVPSADHVSYDNSVSGLSATDVQNALDEIVGDIPTALSELSDDSTHRLVTDSEKAEWNATTPTDTTDDEPYVLRQGKGNQVDFSLEGASVAWNQLVQNGNFASTSNWSKNQPSGTFTVSGNVATVTATTGGIYQGGLNFVANHVYFYCFTIKNTKAMGCGSSAFGSRVSVSANNSFVTYQKLGKPSSSSTSSFDFYNSTSDENTFNLHNVNLIDLTQMFGTTIADAIYSMEQLTSGSGVAFFRKYFPKAYYAYDTGSIQSVCVSERKVYDSDNNLVANYPIPTTQLRGLFSLVNGKLKANGDVLRSDGSGTRKYGIVELNGSESWTQSGSNGFAITRANSGITDVLVAGTKQTPMISNLFPYSSNANVWADGYIGIDNGTIWIADTNYSRFTDLATFKTYLSNHHLWIVYPLATPTSITTSPFQNPQRAYPDGTEEFVDGLTRDVIVPVGNNSTYTTSDVLASADDYTDGMGKMLLPISAVGTDESGRTTASRAYTTGEFFYKDGKMYKALTSIASGATFTVGTNISETTLFAELTALA